MTITQSSDRIGVVVAPPEGSAETADSGVDSRSAGEADGAQVQPGTRPTFTITDAATACSVSRKTITRKLPELAGHGAAKDDDGVWRIPVEALLAVGLHPGRSLAEEAGSSQGRPTQVNVPAPPATDPATITIPRDRWEDIRIRLARAEAEAAERGLALADARLALRALTAVPNVPAAAPAAPGGAAQTTAAAYPAAAHLGSAPQPGIDVAAPEAPDLRAAPVPTAAGAPGGSPLESQPATQPPAASAGLSVGLTDSVVAARQRAAQTGGYVPVAAPERPKKRRWWQTH